MLVDQEKESVTVNCTIWPDVTAIGVNDGLVALDVEVNEVAPVAEVYVEQVAGLGVFVLLALPPQ